MEKTRQPKVDNHFEDGVYGGGWRLMRQLRRWKMINEMHYGERALVQKVDGTCPHLVDGILFFFLLSTPFCC